MEITEIPSFLIMFLIMISEEEARGDDASLFLGCLAVSSLQTRSRPTQLHLSLSFYSLHKAPVVHS